MKNCEYHQQFKKINDSEELSHQSGQAVIEYILVIIVIVAIATGVLYQFNSSFARWATSYFGSYFACLLETGELPGISGSGGDSGVCSQLYEDFKFTAGVVPRIPGGGGGGNTGGGGSHQTRTQGPSRSSGTEASHNDASSSGQASYGRVGGKSRSGSFSQSSLDGTSGSNGKRAKFSKNTKSKGLYTGSTEISLANSLNQQSGQSQKIKISSLDRRYGFSDDQENDKKDKISLSKKDKNQVTSRTNEKIRVNRKVAASEQHIAESSMTFGSFIRFLIIAAIVIALVVLLGGQGLQISKSWE